MELIMKKLLVSAALATGLVATFAKADDAIDLPVMGQPIANGFNKKKS